MIIHAAPDQSLIPLPLQLFENIKIKKYSNVPRIEITILKFRNEFFDTKRIFILLIKQNINSLTFT